MMNMSMRKTSNIQNKKEAEKKETGKKSKKTYSLRHLMSGRVICCSYD